MTTVAAPNRPMQVAPQCTVSVVDWGVGGVDLLMRLRQARPDVQLRYRSDAGFTPWGKLPAPALRARLAMIVAQEVAAGSDAVLLACNAASTALPWTEAMGPPPPLGVHGVIAPTLALLRGREPAAIGVLGGKRTIQSGAWSGPLRAAGHRVRGRIAQALSAQIEAGAGDAPQTRALIAALCRPLRHADIVVLACTHYPAVRPAMADLLPNATLIDPADAALAALLAVLPATEPAGMRQARGSLHVWTSGDPAATREAARLAFAVVLPEVDVWPMDAPTSERVDRVSTVDVMPA